MGVTQISSSGGSNFLQIAPRDAIPGPTTRTTAQFKTALLSEILLPVLSARTMDGTTLVVLILLTPTTWTLSVKDDPLAEKNVIFS